MRKYASTILLLVVLIAVIGLWFLARYNSDTQRNAQQASKDFILPRVTATEDITLMNGETEIHLRKEQDSWVVSSGQEKFPADETAVSALLHEIDTATMQSIVSRNPEEVSEYGLNQELAITVMVVVEDETVELTIGNPGPIARSYYAMRAGDPAVYIVSGAVSVYKKDVNSWKLSEDASEQEGSGEAPEPDATEE